MHPNKYILLCLFPAVWLSSCIKSFEPGITGSDINKLVVSGIITDRDGNQTVTISTASSVNTPEYKPVTGCIVTVSDTLAHQFPMTDGGDGNYRGFIDPKYLVSGNAFRIDIRTPDGRSIQSDFDRFSPVPEVDSVYYLRKDLPTGDPADFIKGIQFYVNLEGKSTDTRFYRWEAFETWEYHADYPKEWYYNGRIRLQSPPDYSNMVCWITLPVKNIYIASTANFSENRYSLFPLHFVDNLTSRLVYGYSLLVNQYSLSENAYKYWNQLRLNSTSQGGLYEIQPLATKGNLHVLLHPEQDVLGFFGVSSQRSKRIFVKNVQNLVLEYSSSCAFVPLQQYELESYSPEEYPVYLTTDNSGNPSIRMSKECVDCRARFGTTSKPDFWPY